MLLTTAFLPETLRKQRPDILTDQELIEEFKVQNDRGKQGTIEKHAKPTFFATLAISFKPMLIMLNDPTVNLLTAYNTVIFASLYFLASIHSFFFLHIYCLFTLFNMSNCRIQPSQIHSRLSMDIVNGKLDFVIFLLAEVS